jgi:hypothetical protein
MFKNPGQQGAGSIAQLLLTSIKLSVLFLVLQGIGLVESCQKIWISPSSALGKPRLGKTDSLSYR